MLSGEVVADEGEEVGLGAGWFPRRARGDADGAAALIEFERQSLHQAVAQLALRLEPRYAAEVVPGVEHFTHEHHGACFKQAFRWTGRGMRGKGLEMLPSRGFRRRKYPRIIVKRGG